MIKNITWKFLERIITQTISLLVTIILARLLDPEYYGIISIMLVFITIAELFVCDGLATALIQKRDIDELDYSTVICANLILSSVLYLFLFVVSPLISTFFLNGNRDYISVIRILSLRIFFYAIHSVQQAYISRNMMFKKLFYASFASTVISSVIAILSAYRYQGILPLLIQNLSYIIIVTIVLVLIIRETPKTGFSKQRFNSLYGFGSKVLQTTLLIQGFELFQSLIIGKRFSDTDLAFYEKGRRFPYMIVSNMNSSIVSVLFPKMATVQNDKERLRFLTKQYLRFGSYLICPMMLGFAAIAEPFVHIFLTDKWLPCVPLLRAFCFTYLFYPLHSSNNQATKALGRGDICFRVEIIKKVISLIVFITCIFINIEAVVYGLVLCSAVGCLFDGYPNSVLFDYSLKEQFQDFLTPFLFSVVMYVSVSLLSNMAINEVFRLFIQIASGILVYLFLSVISRNEEFLFIVQNMKNLFHKKRSHL